MQNFKDMVKQFLPTWDGRLGIDSVSYLFNGQVQADCPYTGTSNQAKVIAQKVALCKSAGFDLIRITWQGPWSTASQSFTLTMVAECQKQGMQFALLLDPGGMQKWVANPDMAGTTANVEIALTDPTTVAQILDSPAYMPERYVFDFNTGANLQTLSQKFPALKFLAQNTQFGWPNIPDPTKYTSQLARNAQSIVNQKAMNALPSMLVPCLCAHFDDSGQPLPAGVSSAAAWEAAGGKVDLTQSCWGGAPARILASYGGLFLQQQLAITPPSAAVIVLATLDDYMEGTRVEPDINQTLGYVWAT